MTTPVRLTVPLDLTVHDADAAHRDGEGAALAVILRAGEVLDAEHTAHFAIGAIGMFPAVLAGVSRQAAADFLIEMGKAYRRAATDDARETRH